MSEAKETKELAEGLAKFMAATLKEAGDNKGFNLADDAVGILNAAWANLPEAFKGVSLIDDEFKDNKALFFKIWLEAGELLIEELTKK